MKDRWLVHLGPPPPPSWNTFCHSFSTQYFSCLASFNLPFSSPPPPGFCSIPFYYRQALSIDLSQLCKRALPSFPYPSSLGHDLPIPSCNLIGELPLGAVVGFPMPSKPIPFLPSVAFCTLTTGIPALAGFSSSGSTAAHMFCGCFSPAVCIVCTITAFLSSPCLSLSLQPPTALRWEVVTPPLPLLALIASAASSHPKHGLARGAVLFQCRWAGVAPGRVLT